MPMSARNASFIQGANRVAQQFEFTKEDVRRTTKIFLEQMVEGLEQDGANISQIPSYVTTLPNGTEKGLCLAVDVGGTNFRVCSVQLHGDRTFSHTQTKVVIPPELRVSDTAEELFAFFAKQIELFLRTHHSDHLQAHFALLETAPSTSGRTQGFHRLAFTFSHAIDQQGINKGFLIRWSKGFSIPAAVGKDICSLLQDQIKLLNLPVLVTALTNDTVGTLMARAYMSSTETRPILGAVFGTGTNGAYIEKLENIRKLKLVDADVQLQGSREMIINTEWGSFDNQLKILPSTTFDCTLDINSVNPGYELFEKRISGMYLGELLRLAMLSIIEISPDTDRVNHTSTEKDTFGESHSDSNTMSVEETSPMYTQWGLDTSLLSTMAADETPDLKLIRQELAVSVGIKNVNIKDAQILQSLARSISTRAARLAGVAVAAVVIKSECMAPQVVAQCGEDSSRFKFNLPAFVHGKLILVIKRWAKKLQQYLRGTKSELKSTALDTPPPLVSNSSIKCQISDRISSSGTNTESDVERTVDIGVDGSLVELHPGFKDELCGALRDVEEIGEVGESRITIGIAKDGGGIGAALVGLLAEQQQQRQL
ncbi:hypothetical protein BP6252_13047 [Coleophoma cylindrospora]|uniref:Phosphotransferase n=1 Tax=Coleophoma cylindrospora TaxID=1849047 RepID=A0A3D8QE71_9HELO|nr:hypothetical protein BP6252_13047 [Coleophoma cylindrospora]